MATRSVLDDLTSEFLTCSICYDTYRVPKQLPCLHTFCYNCLQEYIQKQFETYRHTIQRIACPLCREEVRIPSRYAENRTPNSAKQWAKSFPDNFFIIGLIEKVESSKVESDDQGPEQQSGSCDDDEPLSRNIGDRIDKFCSSHPDRPSVAYCPVHKVTVCDNCLSATHTSCPDVTKGGTMNIRELITRDFQSSIDTLSDIQSEAEKLKVTVTSHQEGTESLSNTADAIATDYFADIRKSMLEALNKKEQQLKHSLSRQLELQDVTLSQLHTECNACLDANSVIQNELLTRISNLRNRSEIANAKTEQQKVKMKQATLENWICELDQRVRHFYYNSISHSRLSELVLDLKLGDIVSQISTLETGESFVHKHIRCSLTGHDIPPSRDLTYWMEKLNLDPCQIESNDAHEDPQQTQSSNTKPYRLEVENREILRPRSASPGHPRRPSSEPCVAECIPSVSPSPRYRPSANYTRNTPRPMSSALPSTPSPSSRRQSAQLMRQRSASVQDLYRAEGSSSYSGATSSRLRSQADDDRSGRRTSVPDASPRSLDSVPSSPGESGPVRESSTLKLLPAHNPQVLTLSSQSVEVSYRYIWKLQLQFRDPRAPQYLPTAIEWFGPNKLVVVNKHELTLTVVDADKGRVITGLTLDHLGRDFIPQDVCSYTMTSFLVTCPRVKRLLEVTFRRGPTPDLEVTFVHPTSEGYLSIAALEPGRKETSFIATSRLRFCVIIFNLQFGTSRTVTCSSMRDPLDLVVIQPNVFIVGDRRANVLTVMNTQGDVLQHQAGRHRRVVGAASDGKSRVVVVDDKNNLLQVFSFSYPRLTLHHNVSLTSFADDIRFVAIARNPGSTQSGRDPRRSDQEERLILMTSTGQIFALEFWVTPLQRSGSDRR